MTPDRALETIAAYGADSRRWPAAVRADVAALALRDPDVAAALAAARDLDALLDGWARDIVPMAAIDAAALIPAATVTGPADTRRRWFGGAALAAAVAAGIAVFAPMQPATTVVASNNSPVPSATGEGEASGSDAEAFAAVFTPTADEDQII